MRACHGSFCACVWLCVSKHPCLCVRVCSRSHPSCSVARLIGGILVSLESVCDCVFVGWNLCGLCVCAQVKMCVRCSFADPDTCEPSFKSLNVGSENPLYPCVQSSCFQCCGSNYALKVSCILRHHALVGFKEHHRNLSSQNGNIMICATICLCVLHMDRHCAAF